MGAVPLTGYVTIYPKDKTVGPYAATIVGMFNVTGLQVGGGPIVPPDEIDELPDPPPPLVIWGGPYDPPHPEHPIVLPPDLPPVNPPNPIPPPHEGWNYSQAKNGWYHLYIPGPGQPGPKTP